MIACQATTSLKNLDLEEFIFLFLIIDKIIDASRYSGVTCWSDTWVKIFQPHDNHLATNQLFLQLLMFISNLELRFVIKGLLRYFIVLLIQECQICVKFCIFFIFYKL